MKNNLIAYVIGLLILGYTSAYNAVESAKYKGKYQAVMKQHIKLQELTILYGHAFNNSQDMALVLMNIQLGDKSQNATDSFNCLLSKNHKFVDSIKKNNY